MLPLLAAGAGALMGGLLGSQSGSRARRDLADANARATNALNDGYNQGSADLRQWTDRGLGMLDPYMQSGGRANALYGRFLGLDGADAQREAMGTYATSDPFRQFNDDNASRALSRRFQAQGMGDSGPARLAIARAGLERGSQDYNSYLNRLQGQGQQGYGAAQTSAGISANAGQTLGQMRYGLGQQLAGNAISYGNALAGTRNSTLQGALGGFGAVSGFFGGQQRR